MAEQFANTVKKILKAGDLKAFLLAEHLSYDTSYISKWMSGNKTPARRNWQTIAEGIADFTIENCSVESRADMLRIFDLTESSSDKELRDAIEGSILEALHSDQNHQRDIDNQVYGFNDSSFLSHVLPHCTPVERSMEEYLSRTDISEKKVLLSAVSHMLLIQYMDSELLRKGDQEVTVFFDPSQYISNANLLIWYLLNVFSRNDPERLNIYEIKDSAGRWDGHLCIMYDNAVLQSAIEPFSGRTRLLSCTDPLEASAYYNEALSYIRRNNSIECYNAADPMYFQYLLRHQHVSSRSTSFNLIKDPFIPINHQDVYHEVISPKLAALGLDHAATVQEYKRNELRKDTHIVFESTILNFCNNGILRPTTDTDMTISLSLDERKKVIAGLIDEMNYGNENYSFIILKDNNSMIRYSDVSSNVFSTKQQICINPCGTANVYYLMSQETISMFYNWFKYLLSIKNGDILNEEKSIQYLEGILSLL